MTKPKCHVMVGLPGLGKSTLVTFEELLYEKIGLPLFVYSTDKFIEDAAAHFGKTYNEAFEDNIKNATVSMNALLDDAIKERKDVVFDQTNLGVDKRRKIINRMRQEGYEVHCICVIPPGAGWVDAQVEWKHRLKNRPGKTIPEHVLKSMIDSYVEPMAEEGFDTVTYYNMYGVLITVDAETDNDKEHLGN